MERGGEGGNRRRERGRESEREREREEERVKERERELERKRERGGTCKYRGKLHGHTRTFTDNSTCMLLVRSWTRMKELVLVQQTS